MGVKWLWDLDCFGRLRFHLEDIVVFFYMSKQRLDNVSNVSNNVSKNPSLLFTFVKKF